MQGKSSFATFALTIAMLGLLIGLSLRSPNAQGSSSTTAQTYLPGASMGRDEIATVVVVNRTNDPTSPAASFGVGFFDPNGVQLKAVTCVVAAGQSCLTPLTFPECVAASQAGCEFNAVVTPQPQTTPQPADAGTTPPGLYTANLEFQNQGGHFLGVGNPVPASIIPRIRTTTTDGGVTPF